jgi:hypothetical protein
VHTEAARGNSPGSLPGRVPMVCYYCNNLGHTCQDCCTRLSTRPTPVLQGHRSAPWLAGELLACSVGKFSSSPCISTRAVSCQNLGIHTAASHPSPILHVKLGCGPVEALSDSGAARCFMLDIVHRRLMLSGSQFRHTAVKQGDLLLLSSPPC